MTFWGLIWLAYLHQFFPDADKSIEDGIVASFFKEHSAIRVGARFRNQCEHLDRSLPGSIRSLRLPSSPYGHFRRLDTLEKSAKQDIYCAFNISPAILGLPSENLGFSDQDLIESWRIATELLFRPILKVVKRAFEKIFNQKEVISIEIVNIDFNKSGNNTEEIVK